jgi:hypothetical protein
MSTQLITRRNSLSTEASKYIETIQGRINLSIKVNIQTKVVNVALTECINLLIDTHSVYPDSPARNCHYHLTVLQPSRPAGLLNGHGKSPHSGRND